MESQSLVKVLWILTPVTLRNPVLDQKNYQGDVPPDKIERHVYESLII